jgi:hypothetical protein
MPLAAAPDNPDTSEVGLLRVVTRDVRALAFWFSFTAVALVTLVVRRV